LNYLPIKHLYTAKGCDSLTLIGAASWSSIINKGHDFEIHLDTDRSYNPIYPNMFKSFSVILNCKEINGALPVVVFTNVIDSIWNPQTFMLSTSKDFIETKVYKRFKKAKSLFLILSKDILTY